MYQLRTLLLGVLVSAAAITLACGPTDAGISTKVKTNFTADQTVNTAQIDVGVSKKIVTLSGVVETPAIKQQAVAVARQTDGVADVVDQLTIKEQGSGPGFGHEMMERGMKMENKEHTKEEGKHN